MTKPGIYSEDDGSRVATNVARPLWAKAAMDVLKETAERYNAVVTYAHLGEQVQRRTQIRTNVLLPNWIGKVLGQVATQCAQEGELLMTALCVRGNGMVGDGYAEAVIIMGEPRPGDPEMHAAEQRLACYRKYATDLPPGGGTPQLTIQEAERRQGMAPLPTPALCPTCHTVLPRSKVCYYCN